MAKGSGSVGGRWAKVPETILDLSLTRQELRAFVALSANANGSREAFVSQRTLAARLGVDRRSIRRLLGRLETLGLIEKVSSRRGRQDRYAVAPFELGASEGAQSTRGSGRIPDTKWAHSGHEVGASDRAPIRSSEEQRAASEPSDSPPEYEPQDPRFREHLDQDPWRQLEARTS